MTSNAASLKLFPQKQASCESLNGGGIFCIMANLFVFVLPALANVIEHAASTILALLAFMGCWAFFTRREKIEFSLPEKSVMVAFAAYFIVCVFSIPIHSIALDAYQPDWALGHEFRMLLFLPVYFLFLHAKLKPGAFWYGICFGAIVNGIYACLVIYLLERGGRATGAYNPIVFGDASMVLSFMSLASLRFFEKKHQLLIFIPIAAATLGLVAVFLSGTRGAILAGPLLLLVFLFQLGGRSGKWRLKALLLAVLAILVAGGYLLTGTALNKSMRSGMETVAECLKQGEVSLESSVDRSTAIRLKMWTESTKIIQAHPWVGTGDEGFERILKKKAETDPSLSPLAAHNTPHNMYLANQVAYGIFGLLMLLGIFLAPLRTLIRNVRHNDACRDAGYAGIMLIMGYMQFALTESVFQRTVPITVYLVLTAAAMAFCRLYKDESSLIGD